MLALSKGGCSAGCAEVDGKCTCKGLKGKGNREAVEKFNFRTAGSWSAEGREKGKGMERKGSH